MKVEIWSLDADSYVAHDIHRQNLIWNESNCYVDLWIELLHQLQVDPVACLPFTLAVDFEGDQWTFFKPSLHDLWQLYGIDVQELNIWRSPLEHVQEQVALGRPVLMEVDAFYLPDVVGTSYRTVHDKTTIGIQMVDAENRQLGYFHNAGYFTLEGEDFAGIFRLGEPVAAQHLAPYAEFVKLDGSKSVSADEQLRVARDVARIHLQRRPLTNPFTRFRARFEKDMLWLTEQDMETYHKYAFSTVRQCGAAFEYASVFLRWLDRFDATGIEQAAENFASIAATAKTLLMKMARAVRNRKEFDFDTPLVSMEENWNLAMERLSAILQEEAPDHVKFESSRPR